MRKYLVFAIIILTLFMDNVNSTIVSVAFPKMVTHFGTSLVLTGWVISIYLLVSIGALPIVSRFSDTVGRKSTFLFCLGMFTTGSFLSAIAPNIGWLIFFRAIQAIGGGGFLSASVGIITDEFPAERLRMVGLLTSINSVGAIAGPSIGGFMLGPLNWGWRSVFWVNVPLGIIALLLCWVVVRADVKKAKHSELDFLGVGLLVGSVSTVMISLTLMGKAYHVPFSVIALALLLGLCLLVLFLLRSRNRPGAVVSLELLSRRPFLAANLYSFIFGIDAQSGVLTLMPLYATTVYGMSTLQSGLILTPRSFGMLIISIVASFFLPRWGYRRPIIAGTITMALAILVLAIEPRGINVAGISVTPVILITLLSLIIGIGAGMAAPASNNACIELMPDKAASITGLRQMSRRVGGVMGVSMGTLILESSGDMARGFTTVFLVTGSLLLLVIGAVFLMPKGPGALAATKR